MAGKTDRIRYTILCEGTRDYYFAKSFIEKVMGKERTEFYRSQTIPGSGSGEQQVRMLFPNELAARRKRSKHENHWLVVLTDGDGFTPNDRRSLLYQEVQNRSMAKPKSDERYVIFMLCFSKT